MKAGVGRLVMLVVVAATGIEGFQHWLMRVAPMSVYHLSSALFTLGLVVLVAWQMETWLRYLEATARAERLAEANAELERALRELARSDRLAAAGAVAAPLSEKLGALLDQLPASAIEPSERRELAHLLDELGNLTSASRRLMRPIDIATLARMVAAEIAARSGFVLDCVAPPKPVWVKANPARLEMALRHFIAHAAKPGAERVIMVVIDARDGVASVAIAGPRQGGGQLDQEESLNWHIAQAVVTECGGSLTVVDDPDGVVSSLTLPLGPVPPKAAQPALALALD